MAIKFAFYDVENIPVEEWNRWLNKWWSRVDGKPDQKAMIQANPKFVLRNWMAQLAIDAAEKDDYSIAIELHELLKKPYDEQVDSESDWFQSDLNGLDIESVARCFPVLASWSSICEII